MTLPSGGGGGGSVEMAYGRSLHSVDFAGRAWQTYSPLLQLRDSAPVS